MNIKGHYDANIFVTQKNLIQVAKKGGLKDRYCSWQDP